MLAPSAPLPSAGAAAAAASGADVGLGAARGGAGLGAALAPCLSRSAYLFKITVPKVNHQRSLQPAMHDLM